MFNDHVIPACHHRTEKQAAQRTGRLNEAVILRSGATKDLMFLKGKILRRPPQAASSE